MALIGNHALDNMAQIVSKCYWHRSGNLLVQCPYCITFEYDKKLRRRKRWLPPSASNTFLAGILSLNQPSLEKEASIVLTHPLSGSLVVM